MILLYIVFFEYKELNFSENFGKLNSECIESTISKPTLCLVFKNSLLGLPSPLLKSSN